MKAEYTDEDFTVENLANIIHDIFYDCLFREGEDASTFIKVQGVVHTFGFHPERLEDKRDIVKKCLDQLPDEFSQGSGYSFLGLCRTKDGDLWGEHTNCEQLAALAIGLKLMEYVFPKGLWCILPGGVPYLVMTEESNG